MGRIGSVGSTGVAVTDDVFDTRELLLGVCVVVVNVSLTELCGSIKDESVTVVEMEMGLLDSFTIAVVSRVVLEGLPEATTTVTVDLACIGEDDGVKGETGGSTLVDSESVEIVEEEYTGNEDGFPITTVFDGDGSVNVPLSVTRIALDPSVTLLEYLEVIVGVLTAETVLLANDNRLVLTNVLKLSVLK